MKNVDKLKNIIIEHMPLPALLYRETGNYGELPPLQPEPLHNRDDVTVVYWRTLDCMMTKSREFLTGPGFAGNWKEAIKGYYEADKERGASIARNYGRVFTSNLKYSSFGAAERRTSFVWDDEANEYKEVPSSVPARVMFEAIDKTYLPWMTPAAFHQTGGVEDWRSLAWLLVFEGKSNFGKMRKKKIDADRLSLFFYLIERSLGQSIKIDTLAHRFLTADQSIPARSPAFCGCGLDGHSVLSA